MTISFRNFESQEYSIIMEIEIIFGFSVNNNNRYIDIGPMYVHVPMYIYMRTK